MTSLDRRLLAAAGAALLAVTGCSSKKSDSEERAAIKPPPPPASAEAELFPPARVALLEAPALALLPPDTPAVAVAPSLSRLYQRLHLSDGLGNDDEASTALAGAVEAHLGRSLTEVAQWREAGVAIEEPVAVAVVGDAVVAVLPLSEPAAFEQAWRPGKAATRGRHGLLVLAGSDRATKAALSAMADVAPAESLRAEGAFREATAAMNFGPDLMAYLAPAPMAAMLWPDLIGDTGGDRTSEARRRLYHGLVAPLRGVAVGVELGDDAAKVLATAALAEDRGAWSAVAEGAPAADALPDLPVAFDGRVPPELVEALLALASEEGLIGRVGQTLEAMGWSRDELRSQLTGEVTVGLTHSSIGPRLAVSAALAGGARDHVHALREASAQERVQWQVSERDGSEELVATSWPFQRLSLTDERVRVAHDREEPATRALPDHALVARLAEAGERSFTILFNARSPGLHTRRIASGAGILGQMDGALLFYEGSAADRKRYDELRARRDEISRARSEARHTARTRLVEGLGEVVAFGRIDGDALTLQAAQLPAARPGELVTRLVQAWYEDTDEHPDNQELSAIEDRLARTRKDLERASREAMGKMFEGSLADLEGSGYGDVLEVGRGGLGPGGGGTTGSGGTGWGSIGSGSYGQIGHGKGSGGGKGSGAGLGRISGGSRTVADDGSGTAGRSDAAVQVTSSVTRAEGAGAAAARRLVSRSSARFRRCHARLPRSGGGAPGGYVSIELTIDDDGAVTDVSVKPQSAALRAEPFTRCVAATARGLKVGAGPATVTASIWFGSE